MDSFSAVAVKIQDILGDRIPEEVLRAGQHRGPGFEELERNFQERTGKPFSIKNLVLEMFGVGGLVVPIPELLSKHPLVLPALVTLGERAPEGHLIELVTPAWDRMLKEILRDPTIMHRLDWRAFEEFIAGAYRE